MKKREVGGRSGGEGENTGLQAWRREGATSWERADFCSPGVRETRRGLV